MLSFMTAHKQAEVFLVACMQLYKSLCWSVGWLVHPLVGLSFLYTHFFYKNVYIFVLRHKRDREKRLVK